MFPPPGPAPSNKLKRGRADESSNARPKNHQTAKRQKREQTPPAFWDNLSLVPLCRRALREFERRSKDTTPPERSKRTELHAVLKKKLKRFARHGGPDCQDIIAYPARHKSHHHAAEMNSKGPRSSGSRRGSGSSASSRLNSIKQTMATTLSSKDAAYEQTLIDHHILTRRGAKPSNWKTISDHLMVPRVSLSPSRFTEEEFERFQTFNEEAKTEADVMKNVMPRIANPSHRSFSNRRFANLASLTKGETKPAQPDLYEGSLPSELDRRLRGELSEYIVPTAHTEEALLPNHFTEIKGPDGNASEMKLQATYDVAHGSRAMHRLLSYGQDEQHYDGRARSFASTYHSGTGTLQLYASHVTEPSEGGGDPTYHITQLNGYHMTGNYDTHRAGLTAYRNIQDLAKEERDKTIAYANGIARNRNLETIVGSPGTSFANTGDDTLMSLMATSSSLVESDDTSADELARDFGPPAKRTSHSSEITSSSKRSRTTSTTASRNNHEQWTLANGVFNCFLDGELVRSQDDCPRDTWVYGESGWPDGKGRRWRKVPTTGATEYH